MPILFFVKCERTVLFSVKRDLDPPLAPSYHSQGEFLSHVFLRPKKDGSFKMILNLKNLKSHVEYNKLKMDTLQST